MADTMEKIRALHKCEELFEWRRWIDEIPYIQWPSDWKVKAIPPFSTGVIRYRIRTPKCDNVSVYLDCYEMAGFFNGPYWEVYPHEGDVYRCAMHEADELLKAISECG